MHVPSEVISIVGEFVDHRTLNTCRLVNRQWCYAVDVLFRKSFEQLPLILVPFVDSENFSRVKAVSKHAQLRKAVRQLRVTITGSIPESANLATGHLIPESTETSMELIEAFQGLPNCECLILELPPKIWPFVPNYFSDMLWCVQQVLSQAHIRLRSFETARGSTLPVTSLTWLVDSMKEPCWESLTTFAINISLFDPTNQQKLAEFVGSLPRLAKLRLGIDMGDYGYEYADLLIVDLSASLRTHSLTTLEMDVPIDYPGGFEELLLWQRKSLCDLDLTMRAANAHTLEDLKSVLQILQEEMGLLEQVRIRVLCRHPRLHLTLDFDESLFDYADADDPKDSLYRQLFANTTSLAGWISS